MNKESQVRKEMASEEWLQNSNEYLWNEMKNTKTLSIHQLREQRLANSVA